MPVATLDELAALSRKWAKERELDEMEAAERKRVADRAAYERRKAKAAERRQRAAIRNRQRREGDLAVMAAQAPIVDAAPSVDPVAPKPTVVVPMSHAGPVVRWSLGAPATVEYWMAGWTRLSLLTDYELKHLLTPRMEIDKANVKLWLIRHWQLAPEGHLRDWFRGASGDSQHPSYEAVLAELTPPSVP